MKATPLARILAGTIIGAFFLLCVTAFSALFAFCFQAIWNIVAPLFHGPTLSFPQAWALWAGLVLVSGLFRSKSSSSS